MKIRISRWAKVAANSYVDVYWSRSARSFKAKEKRILARLFAAREFASRENILGRVVINVDTGELKLPYEKTV